MEACTTFILATIHNYSSEDVVIHASVGASNLSTYPEHLFGLLAHSTTTSPFTIILTPARWIKVTCAMPKYLTLTSLLDLETS